VRRPQEAAPLAEEPVVRPREAAPLAEEPVVRPREAAPLAEEPVVRQPREGLPDGTAVSQQRRAVG
jgi:hypothetical protein